MGCIGVVCEGSAPRGAGCCLNNIGYQQVGQLSVGPAQPAAFLPESHPQERCLGAVGATPFSSSQKELNVLKETKCTVLSHSDFS